MKLNPFDDIINDPANNLVNPSSDNSRNYMFVTHLMMLMARLKLIFASLHLSSRSFNRTRDNIGVFLNKY